MLGLIGTLVMYGIAGIIALWILGIIFVILGEFGSWLDRVL